MQSTNLLDQLFKSVKTDLRVKARAEQRTRQFQPKPYVNPYTNPQNWEAGRAIRIVHHTEGPVGVFREYFYKMSTGTRKLLPAAGETVPDQDELVFGDWWLHPRNAAPPVIEPDTPAEEAAIRARFYELINQDWEDAE